jgi:amino acid transporter
MAMSRDGLLPKIFSSIHPKFRTPWFSTLLTGVVVAVPALFMNLTEVTDLSVIGTLFAFVIVCAGVLVKDKEFAGQKRFVPYINSRYIVPAIFAIIVGALFYLNGDAVRTFFSDYTSTEEAAFVHKIPYFVFFAFAVVMTVLCVVKRLSLIPVLGVMCCTYLMTELGITNWIRFGIWLLVGIRFYRVYGFVNSHLNQDRRSPNILLRAGSILADFVLFGWILFPFALWPLLGLMTKTDAPASWITLLCSAVIAVGLELLTANKESNKQVT